MAKEYHLSDIIKKLSPAKSGRKTHREINLVPDIKNEMIKTLKLRNLIFFICIVVASASIGITLIFGLTAGGQQITISNKKNSIDALSEKLNSYSDLSDFLTIKDQIDGISTITNQKTVLSRTFNILSAFLPTGADTITLSNLDVDLSDGQPTFTFDAQANSGTAPFIDFAVLEAFRKSMDEMRYDYGTYVDKNGDSIPAYCMIESGSDGAIFTDTTKRGLVSTETNSIYALWTINGEGCAPASASDNYNPESDYTLEDYEGQKVVRIWRTPQPEWYKENPSSSEAQISLDGAISNVAHFESACTSYSGTKNGNSIAWTKTNDECALVPGGSSEGITVSEATNGRDANEQLVLRFSATILIAPEAYQFTNTHMLAVAPAGRHNVTDSYLQVQAMFSAPATACAADDVDCSTNTDNSNGNNNTNGGQ